jgi:hypothetical protein
MDWEYSEPLNGALLAASKNTNDLTGIGGLGSTFGKTSLYSNYYSDYDPLISRYKARAAYFNRPTDPLLFDDFDDLTLEVEANSILSSRYRPSNQTRYIPSYYDLNKTSFNNNNNNNANNGLINNANNILDNDDFDDNINNTKASIPQQPPGLRNKNNNNNINFKNNNSKLNPKLASQLQPRLNNNNNNNNTNTNANIQSNLNNSSPIIYQQKFQPIPFNQPASNHSNILVNASNPNLQIQAHNSQQQRFLQYQQRIMQQQQQQQQQQPQLQSNEGLSELEILKIKQQQDRQQLLAAIANNQVGPKSNNSINNDAQNNLNYNANLFRQYNKQYSETSIPSTNADPLNSNSPTPPMLTNRSYRNPFEKTTKVQQQQNNNQQKNQLKPSQRNNQQNSEDQNEQGMF